jgi:response regulator of citrate/malate metabolism
MNTLTAEQLFSDLQKLPSIERQQFFVLLSKAFDHEDNLSHQQVFGHLEGELFTASEAAEYLEVSMATFRRYLKAEKLLASTEIGASHLYSLDDLRQFKQALKLTKNT